MSLETEQYSYFPTTILRKSTSIHLWGDKTDVDIARSLGEHIMGFDGNKILKYVKEKDGEIYKVVEQKSTKSEISRERV